MKLSAALAIALAAMLIGLPALAARVRYLSDAGEAFDRRVTAELESVGFEVERNAAREAPLAEDTVAIVAATDEPPRVEVWLVSEGRQAALSTVIERDLAAGADTDSTRVAERLRALLQPLAPRPPAEPELERGPLPPPPPPIREPEPAPPPPLPQPAVDRAPGHAPKSQAPIAFDLGAAALGQPGGIGVSALLRARWEALPPFGAGLVVAVPVTKTRISEGGASAELDARLAGAAAHVSVLPSASDWQLRAGAGAGALWLTALGDAPAPRQGRSESSVVALPFITFDGARRLTGDVFVVAGALAGVTLPRADVELAGEPVAVWGRPLLLAHLGLGYDP